MTISQPGSYRLTGNLTVPTYNVGAIDVTTGGGVTLDLGGFTVRGTRCSGLLCANALMPHGIDGNSNTRVHDGRIENFSGWGFSGNGRNEIERVYVTGNGLGGITASGASRVQDSSMTLNQGFGLSLLSGIARGNFIAGNTQAQLRGANGAVLISGNTLLGPVPIDNYSTVGPVSMNDNLCAPSGNHGQRC